MEKIETTRSYIATRYKANDGEIFATEKDCLSHEKLVEYQKIIATLPCKCGWYYCSTEDELTAAQCNYLASTHIWDTDKQDLPDWFKFEFDDSGDYPILITTSLKTVKREIAELELKIEDIK
jgi:hypothetical protein